MRLRRETETGSEGGSNLNTFRERQNYGLRKFYNDAGTQPAVDRTNNKFTEGGMSKHRGANLVKSWFTEGGCLLCERYWRGVSARIWELTEKPSAVRITPRTILYHTGAQNRDHPREAGRTYVSVGGKGAVAGVLTPKGVKAKGGGDAGRGMKQADFEIKMEGWDTKKEGPLRQASNVIRHPGSSSASNGYFVGDKERGGNLPQGNGERSGKGHRSDEAWRKRTPKYSEN